MTEEDIQTKSKDIGKAFWIMLLLILVLLFMAKEAKEVNDLLMSFILTITTSFIACVYLFSLNRFYRNYLKFLKEKDKK